MFQPSELQPLFHCSGIHAGEMRIIFDEWTNNNLTISSIFRYALNEPTITLIHILFNGPANGYPELQEYTVKE